MTSENTTGASPKSLRQGEHGHFLGNPTLSLWDGERRFEFVGDELLGIQIARTASAAADGG